MVEVAAGYPSLPGLQAPIPRLLGDPLSLEASLPWGWAAFWALCLSSVVSFHHPRWEICLVGGTRAPGWVAEYLQEMDRPSPESMMCVSSVMFRVGGVME